MSIGYSGIENLNLLAGIGDLTLTTTAADDTRDGHAGTGDDGANSGTVSSSGAVPQITFVNSGTLTANLAGGNDALVVNGSSDADTIAVDGSAVAISGRRTVNYSERGSADRERQCRQRYVQRDAVGDDVDVHRRRRPDRRAAGRPAQHHCWRQLGHLQRRAADRRRQLRGRRQPAGELRSYRVVRDHAAAVRP